MAPSRPTHYLRTKGEVQLVNPDTGQPEVMPEEQALEYMRQGWSPVGLEAAVPAAMRQYQQDAEAARYDAPGPALAAGLLRGLTMGGSDLLASQNEFTRGELSKIKEFNPVSSTIGEVGGNVAGMFLPAGPVAATTRLGAGVAQAAERGVVGALGRGVATRGTRTLADIAGTTARGVTEGAAFGLGGGVSELSLRPEPVSATDAASILARHMGAGAAFGGGLGLVFSGGAAAVRGASGKLGLGRASKAIEDLGENQRALEGVGAQNKSELEALFANGQVPLKQQERATAMARLRQAEADIARDPADRIVLEQAKATIDRAAKNADAQAEFLAAKSAHETALAVESNAAKDIYAADEVAKALAARNKAKMLRDVPTVDERVSSLMARSESVAEQGDNLIVQIKRLAKEHGVPTFKNDSKTKELGQVLLDIEKKVNAMAPEMWASYASSAGPVGKAELNIYRLAQRGQTETFNDVLDRVATSRVRAQEGIDAALKRMQDANVAVQATHVPAGVLNKAQRDIAIIEGRSVAGQVAQETRAALAQDDALAAQVAFLKRAPGEKLNPKHVDLLTPDLKTRLAQEQTLLERAASIDEQLGGKKSGLAGKLLGRAGGMFAARTLRGATGSTANSFGTGSGSVWSGALASTAAGLVSSKIGGMVSGGLSLGLHGAGLVAKAAGALVKGARVVGETTRPALLKFGSEEMFNLKQALDAHGTPQAFEYHLRASLADQPATDAERLIQQEVRKYAFLQSKMPRSPQQRAVAAGELPIPTQKRWKPSPTETARYARYVSGIVDPLAVPRMFKAGRLTPEAVEAARAVFPDVLSGFQVAVEAQVRDDYAKGKSYTAAEERNVRTLMQKVPVATPGDMVFQMSFKAGKTRVQPSKGMGKGVTMSKALMPVTDSIQQR